ncbi:protein OBERON 3 [Tanacetum coccineum]
MVSSILKTAREAFGMRRTLENVVVVALVKLGKRSTRMEKASAGKGEALEVTMNSGRKITHLFLEWRGDNSLKALPNMMNTNKMIIEGEWSVKSTKKDAFDSVERIKEAEARMFQTKADEVRRMIRTNIEKLDEEHTEKITKLNLHETEEQRKKKADELKVSENDQCEYYKIKMSDWCKDYYRHLQMQGRS